MNNFQNIISLIENINNFSSFGLTEHEENKAHFDRFKIAMSEADELNMGNMAISYYNFKYMVDIYGSIAPSMYLKWQGTQGTQEECNELINRANGTIMDLLNSQPAWGRKEILGLPYGVEIAETMKTMGKTNLGTKDIIYILFGIKSKVIGFTYYDEFVNLMKTQKTMINRSTAQSLLKMFWENTRDDYKHNPLLFKTIKSVIINLNSQLIASNSTQQIRIRFMQEFLILTTNV